MRKYLHSSFLFIVLVLGSALFSQTFTVTPKTKSTSFSYDQLPFPEGIRVSTLDGKKVTLTVDQLTLVQIWSTCCGAEPETWSRAREMENRYKSLGLKTLSINFENGADRETQFELVQVFIETVRPPEFLYLDTLGYAIDFLKVPGFPTYYLVSADGTIVFRTNGKDNEGLSLLESEIQNRLGS